MLTLCVRQPFAELIARGIKTIELRRWKYELVDEDDRPTGEPFELLIVASSQFASPVGEFMKRHRLTLAECPRSTAVCVVDAICSVDELPESAYLKAACSPASGGSFGWKLSNPRRVRPFFVRGKLNLFEVDDRLIRLSRRTKVGADPEGEP